MNENNKKRNSKKNPKTKNINNKETQQAQVHKRSTETTDGINKQQANHTDRTTTWGNQLGLKDPHKIRFVLQNIGGINMADNGSLKLAALRSFMNAAQVDICALTECNVTWNQAPSHLHPAEQTRYWWEASHWNLSHNQQESNEAAYQPGGTGIVVVNQLVPSAARVL